MLLSQAAFYGKKILNNKHNSFMKSIFILENLTGLTKEKILISQKKISKKLFDKFKKILVLHSKGMPLEYLFKHAKFMGLDFYVNENVLIPRFDTETLVEAVINFIKNNYFSYNKINIIDLCCGSGCIAISIKKILGEEYLLNIFGIDISKRAIAIAKKNAKLNSVHIDFCCADIFKILNNKFCADYNIIISNPPYIKSNEIEKLDDSVKKFEPIIALDGGADGLKFYNFIITKIKHPCKIFFEISFDMASDVKFILQKNNFIEIKLIKDKFCRNRVITAQKIFAD
jgi:release factor glutamine methyltransferase